MNTEVMFSSKTDEWATPQSLFDELNNEFCFDLDPCATEENHKCAKYYTQADNGLNMAWGGAQSVLQSALLKHIGVGCKVLHGRVQREHACRFIDTGKNRHKIFSRLYSSPIRDTFYQRSSEIRRRQKQRTFSEYVGDI